MFIKVKRIPNTQKHVLNIKCSRTLAQGGHKIKDFSRKSRFYERTCDTYLEITYGYSLSSTSTQPQRKDAPFGSPYSRACAFSQTEP